MSTPETRWLGLYNRLGEVLGEEHAETLVIHLGELATKRDLADLRSAIGGDVDGLADHMDRLSDRVDRLADRVDRLTETVASQGRHQVVAVVSSMVGLTAMFTLAVAVLQ